MPAPLINELAYPNTPTMTSDRFIGRKTMILSFKDINDETITLRLSDIQPSHDNVQFTIDDFEDGFTYNTHTYTVKLSAIEK